MAKIKFFQAIGLFFVGLFNQAKKAYFKLSETEQNALVHGSGIVGIINSMTAEAPDLVREAILSKYPDLNIGILENGLFNLAHSFNLVPQSNSLEDIIAVLQGYFAGLTGKVWAGISHSAAGILAIIFAPAETKFAKFAQLLEWVYQTYIKEDNGIDDKEDIKEED